MVFGTLEGNAEQPTRRELSELTDRELLEEMAGNMRFCADMLAGISSVIQSDGLAGVFKSILQR